MSMERSVPIRSALLSRNGADHAPTVPGRYRRARAVAANAVPVTVAGGVGGFTLAALEAAVENLKAQGHSPETPLVAKVTDHPLDADFPDARLVAVLALVAAPDEDTEGPS